MLRKEDLMLATEAEMKNKKPMARKQDLILATETAIATEAETVTVQIRSDLKIAIQMLANQTAAMIPVAITNHHSQ